MPGRIVQSTLWFCSSSSQPSPSPIQPTLNALWPPPVPHGHYPNSEGPVRQRPHPRSGRRGLQQTLFPIFRWYVHLILSVALLSRRKLQNPILVVPMTRTSAAACNTTNKNSSFVSWRYAMKHAHLFSKILQTFLSHFYILSNSGSVLQ